MQQSWHEVGAGTVLPVSVATSCNLVSLLHSFALHTIEPLLDFSLHLSRFDCLVNPLLMSLQINNSTSNKQIILLIIHQLHIT